MKAPPSGNLLVDGRFELARVLGSGSRAVLVAALDRATGTERALVVLRREAAAVPEERAAFEATAGALIGLDHARLVRVHEVRSGPRVVAAVTDLAPRAVTRPLAPGLSVRVVLQVCEALAALHAAGLRHGDVSRPHVLVGRDGEARLLGVALSEAPSTDARDDVSGAGTTLFALVTGEDPSVWLRDRAHDLLPDRLRVVVERATSERPNLRYPSVRALAEALEACLSGLPAGEVLPAEPPGGVTGAPTPDEIAAWFADEEPSTPPPEPYTTPAPVPPLDEDRPAWLVDEPPPAVERPRRFAHLPAEPTPPPRPKAQAPRRRVPVGLVVSGLVAALGVVALVTIPLIEPARRVHEERAATEESLRAEMAGQRDTVATLAAAGADAARLEALLVAYERAATEEERWLAAVEAFTAIDADARRLLVERSAVVDRANASLTSLDFALQEYQRAHHRPIVELPGR